MTNNNYIRFIDCADCETLNNLCFTEFVYDNGAYKWPFSTPTDRYLDCIVNPINGLCLTYPDERVYEFATRNPTVAALITDQITYQEAVDEGWPI